ncbi:MAG: hypothetical protein PHH26_09020 [Candidatus Thermoplasmatota archaeon]|nr:hypothetical protein [Candidatus Thermoplasmatota archaeon]
MMKAPIIILISIGFLMSAYTIALFLDSPHPGTIDYEAASSYGWEKTVSDKVLTPGGTMTSARTYQYKGTSRPFGTLTVLTYSYPIPKGLMSDDINLMSLKSTIWNTWSGYNMIFGPMVNKTEFVGGYETTVHYYDFTSISNIQGGFVVEASGKFIVTSLSSNGGILRETSNVIYGFSLTKTTIKSGSLALYQSSEDMSTYNQMYKMIHESFVVE